MSAKGKRCAACGNPASATPNPGCTFVAVNEMVIPVPQGALVIVSIVFWMPSQ